MNISRLLRNVIMLIFVASIATLSSCSKNSKLVSYEGRVVNPDGKSVARATIQIFETPEDWLTGHNVLATMTSDFAGHFESEPIFEPGEYYIFVEKYDSSNWEIRKVEQGVYPTVNIPEDKGGTFIVDHNNMSLMASTQWVLTNVHKEYTKPGHTAIEWQSIWTSTNNCRRDNYIQFNKDLSMRISEGDILCSSEERNVLGSFIPPIIFSNNSCTSLPNTSQSVKEFEYSGWPGMKAKEGKMYLACSSAVGEMYVYYKANDGKMMLDVYSRR